MSDITIILEQFKEAMRQRVNRQMHLAPAAPLAARTVHGRHSAFARARRVPLRGERWGKCTERLSRHWS